MLLSKEEKRTKKQMKIDRMIEAEDNLNIMLDRHQTIYCIIRHVARSGMTRHISFFIIKDNEPWFLDGKISDYLDYKRNKDYSGLVVHGCGMDMAFSVVHHLQEQMKHSKNTTYIDYDFSHRFV
jgi:predicted hydrolase (HD superfamily)